MGNSETVFSKGETIYKYIRYEMLNNYELTALDEEKITYALGLYRTMLEEMTEY